VVTDDVRWCSEVGTTTRRSLAHPRWAGSREAELGDGAPSQGEVALAMTGGASAAGAQGTLRRPAPSAEDATYSLSDVNANALFSWRCLLCEEKSIHCTQWAQYILH
jgi:hypothetical protein